MIERQPVEWVPQEGEESVDAPHMTIRVADDWFAVDSDQLVLPVVVLEKSDGNGEKKKIPPNGYRAVLKQYGGEGLLNDMLLSGEPVEAGSTWEIVRVGPQLDVSPVDLDDDE